MSAYIVKNYIGYMYQYKTELIEALLHFLNEYSESNGNLMYQAGIRNLEELLYHI